VRIEKKFRILSQEIKLAAVFLCCVTVLEIMIWAFITSDMRHQQVIARENRFTVLSERFEGRLGTAESIAIQLIKDETVGRSLYAKSAGDISYEQRQYLINMLSIIRKSLDNGASVYIAFEKSSTCFAYSGTFYSKLLFKGYESNLTDYLTEAPDEKFVYMRNLPVIGVKTENKSELLVMIYKVPNVAVAISFSASNMIQLIEGALSEDNSVGAVLTSDGRMLCASSDLFEAASVEDTEQYLAELNRSKSGKRYSFETREIGRFIYVIGFDHQAPSIRTQNNTLLFSISIILGMCFIIVFIFMLNREIYIPIRQIVDKINIGRIGRKDNVYAVVENAITKMYLHINQLTDKLSESEALNKNDILSKLISDTSGEIPFIENFDEAERFCILTATFETTEGYDIPAAYDSFCKKIEHDFTIKRIDRIDGHISWYVAIGEQSVDKLAELVRTQLIASTAENFSIAGISMEHTGIQNISIAYNESCEVFDCSLPAESFFENTIFYQSRSHPLGEKKLNVNLQDLMRLATYINKGDRTSISKYLAEIRKNNSQLSVLKLRELWTYILCLLSGIQKSESGNANNEVDMDTVKHTFNPDLMYSIVLRQYLVPAQPITEGFDEIYKAILAYVDKNYSKDIYLKQIADEVGLSYSYVSRCFKKKRGLGFLEFLGNMRLEKACQLLTETNMGIADISNTVGIPMPSTFFRTFKKLFGVTPGEYRHLHQSKHQDEQMPE